MDEEFLGRLRVAFPDFAAKLEERSALLLEDVLPPVSDDISSLEIPLGIPLPESYKAMLRCSGGFSLLGGGVRFDFQHPFFHDFKPLNRLNPTQQREVRRKGGQWPPPSQGMLCFADFFMEADGDQLLLDVSRGLLNGEYPVLYYSHESQPPSVRKLADTFPEFLKDFLDYPAFAHVTTALSSES
jgi:hypothetical protein